MDYQAGNLERVNRRRLSFANASAEDVLLGQKRFEGAGAKDHRDEAENGKKMVGKKMRRTWHNPG
jgi:hypothetical protein